MKSIGLVILLLASLNANAYGDRIKETKERNYVFKKDNQTGNTWATGINKKVASLAEASKYCKDEKNFGPGWSVPTATDMLQITTDLTGENYGNIVDEVLINKNEKKFYFWVKKGFIFVADDEYFKRYEGFIKGSRLSFVCINYKTD